jgi:predicted ATP-dependent serine protease
MILSQIFSYNEIKECSLVRYSTGFPDLDRIYGITQLSNGKCYVGLPAGKISLWAGAGGVGKTRVAVEMVLRMSSVGIRNLFYQNEVSPEEFKGWVKKPVIHPENLFVGNIVSLDEQIKGIRKILPQVVIVDSINMMEGFSSPDELRNILQTYKNVAEETKCHVIFISHLNKQGDVKGNNDVKYLVDMVVRLFPHINPKTKKEVKGIFVLEIGKNRYGPSGGWICFKHTDVGIEFVISSLSKVEEAKTQDSGDFVKVIHGSTGKVVMVPREVAEREGTFCENEWNWGNIFKKMFG